MSISSVKVLTLRPSAQFVRFLRGSPSGLPSEPRLALTERSGAGEMPLSAAIRRKDTPTSICLTPRGHLVGQLLQVVHRHISSPSISGKPKLAWRTMLRMLNLLTRFHGQTTSHSPH